jgi:hypothetical protein
LLFFFPLFNAIRKGRRGDLICHAVNSLVSVQVLGQACSMWYVCVCDMMMYKTRYKSLFVRGSFSYSQDGLDQSINTQAANSHQSVNSQSIPLSALAARVGVGALGQADLPAAGPVEQGRLGLEARQQVELGAHGRAPVVLQQAARVAALLCVLCGGQ